MFLLLGNPEKSISYIIPDTPWDCHRTADQGRGGARGVNGAAYMAYMECLGIILYTLYVDLIDSL